MPVLDTAALLHWPVERLQGGIVAHQPIRGTREIYHLKEQCWLSLSKLNG